MAQTLFDKIWDAHKVTQLKDESWLIYVDRIFLHERTGSVALNDLREQGRSVKYPRHVFATMDHIVDTFPGRGDKTLMPGGEMFIRAMRQAAADFDITLFDINDPRHGISHLIAAEQGLALPGTVVACPDSHTCTLGALGALGWGIGSSDCEHALATQTLRGSRPKQMRIRFTGALGHGVTAKDMVLHLIGRYSTSGGSGYAIEFSGDAVRRLDVSSRSTLCNMAVEFSAFTGLIAPDNTVIDYVHNRPYAPQGQDWDDAVTYWHTLHTDDDAHFDQEIVIDCADIAPTITWGTSPQHTIAINGTVPSLDSISSAEEREALHVALDYMGLQPEQSLLGIPIDGAFIGSCTNGRLEDLRQAAAILNGRQVADGVRAICTPGSMQAKADAEKEGLDTIFTQAGFEWREPGCSLCFHAGGEGFGPKERVISSTNRNFRGRQGQLTRSHLASPASVAASAVTGSIADVRTMSS